MEVYRRAAGEGSDRRGVSLKMKGAERGWLRMEDGGGGLQSSPSTFAQTPKVTGNGDAASIIVYVRGSADSTRRRRSTAMWPNDIGKSEVEENCENEK